jgi:GDP-L-fucose synthase
MPTNLYGPGDNYHSENSHVIPALIRRFHEAKTQEDPTVLIWGSGTPRREFQYVDDMAEASVRVMNMTKSDYDSITLPMQSLVNVGSSNDITIHELAQIVSEVVGYSGSIEFDTSKPDGTPRKLMDSQRLVSFVWNPADELKQGLMLAYDDFVKNINSLRSK